MQGPMRKVVYVTFFELIAIGCTTIGLTMFSDHGAGHASIAAVASSTIAVVWNLAYNTLFELWESRQVKKGRSVARRVAHAVGFEAGMLAMLVPLFAWWLDISLWHAFLLDFGLVVFFLGYTFAFSWAFDTVFGLPASARA